MKKIALLVLALILLGSACNKEPEQTSAQYADGSIHLAGRSISFELAQSDHAKSVGLSGRQSIEENQGMLFQLNVPSMHTFWMKDMLFPIDIIWLKDNEIIDISSNAEIQSNTPDDQLKTYVPKQPANWVLELKAGWAERNNLKIGDKIEVLQYVNT